MPLDFEDNYYKKGYRLIVGMDEAGRGCLLGPVFAGAVILPEDFECELINDSKKLSEKQREKAYKIITENAIAWGVGSCSVEEIDEMNILNASRVAMIRAIQNMKHDYDLVLTAMDEGHNKTVSNVHLSLEEDNEGPVFEDTDDFVYSDIRVLGDIYICIPQMKRQAQSYGHSEKRELAFLAVHGLLHLLGYDHMNKDDEKKMFTIQKKIVKDLK